MRASSSSDNLLAASNSTSRLSSHRFCLSHISVEIFASISFVAWVSFLMSSCVARSPFFLRYDPRYAPRPAPSVVVMKIPVYSAAVPNGEASGCGSACFCAARSEAAVRPARRTPRAACFGFILGTPLGHWLPFCDLHSPLCVGPVTYVSLPYRAGGRLIRLSDGPRLGEEHSSADCGTAIRRQAPPREFYDQISSEVLVLTSDYEKTQALLHDLTHQSLLGWQPVSVNGGEQRERSRLVGSRSSPKMPDHRGRNTDRGRRRCR